MAAFSPVPVLVKLSLRDTDVERLPHGLQTGEARSVAFAGCLIARRADAPPLRHRGWPPPLVLPVEEPGGADSAPPPGAAVPGAGGGGGAEPGPSHPPPAPAAAADRRTDCG